MNGTQMKIGWGFIGASTIADEHMVKAVRSQPDNEIVAVASASLERAVSFAAAHGIARPCDSVAELLDDPAVDAVYISTTNDLHHQQVIAAAAAGKHVLCEKPLAMSVEDTLEMVAACKRAGVQMATNHHLRNAGSHRVMRDLVRSGALGRVLFVRVFHAIHLRPKVQGWRINRPDAGGGPILDIAVHDVDTVRFILDAEPVEAIGLAQSASMAQNGLEDGVMAVLRLDTNALVHIHAAFTVPFAGTGLEIHGEKGSLVAREVLTAQQPGEVLLRDAQGERRITFDNVNVYAEGVARFCDAMRGDGSVSATGEDGVRSLASALAIAESCRTGSLVRIPPSQVLAFAGTGTRRRRF